MGVIQSEMTAAFRRYVPESEINRVQEEIAMSQEEPETKSAAA